MVRGLPQLLNGKEPACNARAAGDLGSIPALGRSPGGGHGNPLQYSCLENPMGRGAWWAVVHTVTMSLTESNLAGTYQWLGPGIFTAVMWVHFLVWELRSQKLRNTGKNIK